MWPGMLFAPPEVLNVERVEFVAATQLAKFDQAGTA
jgi:hypothetical protein